LKTHASLFSGIGGFEIATHWAGFTTVFQCEIDPILQALLRLRFPGVPLIGDIKNVTKETFSNAYREWEQQQGRGIGNVRGRLADSGKAVTTHAKYNGCNESEEPQSLSQGKDKGRLQESKGRDTENELIQPRLTLLTAGVPCQPSSVAGKRRGKEDDRWLWPEAIRVLSELQPSWAVFENPAGIGSLGEFGKIPEVGKTASDEMGDWEAAELDRICGDIEAHGYEVQPVCIPACAVGAPHSRERIFIIAHATSSGYRGGGNRQCGIQERDMVQEKSEGREIRHQIEGCSESSPNAKGRETREISGGSSVTFTHPQSIVTPGLSSREVKKQSGLGFSGGKPNPYSESEGFQGKQPTRGTRADGRSSQYSWKDDWVEVAAALCGMDDGLSVELDGLKLTKAKNREFRLRSLGNAYVPAQGALIFKAIADIENFSD
jgi:DNA (cytosine-5)-methyltransferase 1